MVTFGSFNNPAKLNDQVIALWAQVLAAVPASRLRLKFRALFGQEGLCRRIRAGFAAHGIGGDRLDLVATASGLSDHMALYHGIDIALDPFPFKGSTTTFEALWMGVPVVALMGNLAMGRWTAALLHQVGCDDWVGADERAYVAIAARLAADPLELARIRANLRDRVAASPICAPARATRNLERVYRAMWRRWCAASDRR